MDCTRREQGSLLNKAYSRLIAALSGRVVVFALLCAGWIISTPAWSQTCIEDGGQMECTSPRQGTPSYTIIMGVGLTATGSDQDVYNAIYEDAITDCSETVQPPPYTWTLVQKYFPVITWTTTVQQSTTILYPNCSSGTIVENQSFTWDVTKSLPQSCPDDSWTPNNTATATYPTGYCSRPRVQPCQAGQPTQCLGDPIDPISGNEVEREVDYSGGGSSLQFVRTYNYRSGHTQWRSRPRLVTFV